MRRLIALVVVLVVTPAASAATLTITITGTSVTAPGVTLNGVDQTSTFPIAATVAYTAPTNTAGWNVTASSTTLTSGVKTLPALILTTVSAAGCTGGGCVNPTNSVTWPLTIGTTAVKIFNAAANTGKGSVVITGTYKVTYPANALPGAYTAVVTLTSATGP
jgi:hypothetical protein